MTRSTKAGFGTIFMNKFCLTFLLFNFLFLKRRANVVFSKGCTHGRYARAKVKLLWKWSFPTLWRAKLADSYTCRVGARNGPEGFVEESRRDACMHLVRSMTYSLLLEEVLPLEVEAIITACPMCLHEPEVPKQTQNRPTSLRLSGDRWKRLSGLTQFRIQCLHVILDSKLRALKPPRDFLLRLLPFTLSLKR